MTAGDGCEIRAEPEKGAPVKVLHVLGALDRGGVETWLLELLPRIEPSQWQFDFCTLGPDCGRYASLARLRGSLVWACPLRSGDGGPFSFALRLGRILRSGGYRVVHSHVHHFSGFVLGVARAAGVPIRVAHSHNTADGCADTLGRALYRSTAVLALGGMKTAGLACSAEAAEPLFGRNWRRDPRVAVLHYGLDVSGNGARNGASVRRALGIPEGVPVVGHVGRFDPQKNHDFLLEVAAALQTHRPRVRWLLVGEGERRPAVQRRARLLGLKDRVLFAGGREDVARLMRHGMDAFVLPSLHEGLPLALLEAQAAGLRSLVSSNISREAGVVEGAVEFLPLAAGPQAWAERTLACLEAGRISDVSARGQLQAKGFSIDQSLARLLEVYRGSNGGLS